MRTAACSTCGETVIWAQFQKSGRRAPFDAESVPRGTRGAFALHEVDKAAVLAVAPTDQDSAVYVSHFSTCPQAEQHRRSA